MLSTVHEQQRLELYKRSVGTLDVRRLDDMAAVLDLEKQFPGLHTAIAEFKGSKIEISFSGHTNLPQMGITLDWEVELDDPQLGLYPPEDAKFQLVSLQAGQPEMHPGLIEIAESISENEDEEQHPDYYADFDDRYRHWRAPQRAIRPLRVSVASARQTVLESVLKTARVLRLHSRAISYDDLITISRISPHLQYLGAIVSASTSTDANTSTDDTRVRSEFESFIELLGECPNLRHLGLYIIPHWSGCALGFPQLHKIQWRSLERFEYYVDPKGVVRNQFGKDGKPWSPAECATSLPSSTLKNVKLFFGPQPNLVNPSAFVAAMMEVYPIDTNVEWVHAEAQWEGGNKPYEYARPHCANAFVTWARELWERIHQQMTGKEPADLDWPDDWAVETRNVNGHF
jgi:hypothetical protein